VLELVFWGSFALLAYSYVFYPLLLYVITKNKKAHTSNDAYTPNVTIVIAAYNEEKVIEDKIKNILSLSYPQNKMEIIIGSDNSSDNTVNVANSYCNKGNIRVFDYKDRSGKLGTINKLVREAKGELLVLTDANCMFSQDSVSRIAGHFSDLEVGCVAGEKTIVSNDDHDTSEGEGIYWKIESFLRQKESDLGSCAGADGAIYAIRKELYPFPPGNLLLMDDFIISLSIIRKKFRCIYEKGAKAFEESSGNFKSELRRKGRIFAGALNALLLVPDLLLPFKSPIAFQLWSHKILRWIGGIFLISLLISNCLLIDKFIYKYIMIPHLVFYILAIIGCFLSIRGVKIKLFYIPFYFLFMNFSQLNGFVTFFKERNKGFWERVGR
jgi:cellulose synthase/poly-beta-1,6-N-acetylglucosamine synthase-like glycosyltransferase